MTNVQHVIRRNVVKLRVSNRPPHSAAHAPKYVHTSNVENVFSNTEFKLKRLNNMRPGHEISALTGVVL